MLQHLRTEHNISTETVSNDLHSFIRDQDIHRDAYIEYYRGLSSQESGSKANSTEEQESAYAEAVACYTKAIELNPDFLRSYVNRGTVYCRIGDVERAIDDYNTVIKRDPIYAEIYHLRGAAYVSKGDSARAIQNFDNAIELNTENANAIYNRGEVWLNLHEWEKARADLTTAKDLGTDIIASFRGDYESVADFEKKHNIKLPADIAALLTPSQR